MAGRPPSERSRYRLAAFMTGAGVLHFVAPRFYEAIVPSWVGHEQAVVRWSGIAEVASGALVAALAPAGWAPGARSSRCADG